MTCDNFKSQLLQSTEGLAQYADRLPIGKESIIRNVPAETVKAFYEKWYTADRMAVILMGDMTELDSIPGIMEKHLGSVRSSKSGQVNDAPRQASKIHSCTLKQCSLSYLLQLHPMAFCDQHPKP